MAIEIVEFPMKNGGSFHSYVAVYQRVADLAAFDLNAVRICYSKDGSKGICQPHL